MPWRGAFVSKEQLVRESVEGQFAIACLAAVLSRNYRYPGRDVRHTHRRFDFVAMLAAWAACPECLNSAILFELLTIRYSAHSGQARPAFLSASAIELSACPASSFSFVW